MNAVKGTIELSSWRGGRDQNTYGFRTSLKARDIFLPQIDWSKCHKAIFLLPRSEGGPTFLESQITDSFRNNCPEFRFTKALGSASGFKHWMQTESGGLTWPCERPHRYEAEVTIGNEASLIEVIKVNAKLYHKRMR